MARNVGDTILAAAQQVVGQLQTQQQLQLQMAQFGEQIKRAEEMMQLREQGLELKQKNLELRAQSNEIAAINAATGQAQAGVAQERLALEKSLKSTREALSAARTAHLEAQTRELEQSLAGGGTGAEALDPTTAGGRFIIKKVEENAPNFVTNNPERFFSEEELEALGKFRGQPLDLVQRHITNIGQQITNLSGLADNPRIQQQISRLRGELELATRYATGVRNHATEIASGANAEAQRDVLRPLVLGSANVEERLDALQSIARLNGIEDEASELDLRNALIRPAMKNTGTQTQLNGVLDSFTNQEEDSIEATATILDEILQESPDTGTLRSLMETFNALGKSRNPNFDPSRFVPVWIELGRIRGLSPQNTR